MEKMKLCPVGLGEPYSVEVLRISPTWGIYRSPENRRKWYVLHMGSHLRMGWFSKTRAKTFAETLCDELPSYGLPGENSDNDKKLIGLYRNVKQQLAS